MLMLSKNKNGIKRYKKRYKKVSAFLKLLKMIGRFVV